MKDQVIAILEAMRLSQAALEKHFQPGGPNAEATIKGLLRLLEDENVVAAMEALYPNVESPNMLPNDMLHVEGSDELHPASRQTTRLVS
jgi:hypothetical protein